MCPHLCRMDIILCVMTVFIVALFHRGKTSVELNSTRSTPFGPEISVEQNSLGTAFGRVEKIKPGTLPISTSDLYENSSSIVIADAPSHRVLSRHRRSVLQLASMLKCVTGCSPLAFQGYGCFCGYMGDGAPVDPIDTCCLEHDWCYSATRCSHLSTYLLPYHWGCAGPGIAYCSLTDSLSPHYGCAQQLCDCDLQFARCISRYPCPGHRPSCHHGGRSLIRDVLNGKAALHHWRIQHTDPLAVAHLVDHILQDEDDGKEVKKKSKKKITLSAGVHRDPFATSWFPNLHANVQIEKDNEQAKKKSRIRKSLLEMVASKERMMVPVFQEGIAVPFSREEMAVSVFQEEMAVPVSQGGAAIPAFQEGMAVPAFQDFRALMSRALGEVLVRGATSVSDRHPKLMKSQSSTGSEKKVEKLVAESKITPKFDKVFRHDVDVALYLRTSPKPSNNRFPSLPQTWFNRYYDSIANLANRNFTKVFEVNRPETKPSKFSHRKNEIRLPASDSTAAASQSGSPSKKLSQYYGESGLKQGTKRYDVDRITYVLGKPLTERPKYSRILFPGPSRL
ncbi:uncharacterized protein LOC100899826 [Galendromus occidentalis]|uniref:Uncharacterized protein LOC100899826 n=1 Tax=Galendromus occidentalis TaxID=34638 RepID=A0AAJ6QQ67_9ACAR|nr:uncharacterized protein LOC100899826 [Galendromus occidentalis]